MQSFESTEKLESLRYIPSGAPTVEHDKIPFSVNLQLSPFIQKRGNRQSSMYCKDVRMDMCYRELCQIMEAQYPVECQPTWGDRVIQGYRHFQQFRILSIT